MESLLNQIKDEVISTNGESFQDNPLLVDLFDKISIGVFAYNNIIRKPTKEMQEEFLHFLRDMIHQKLNVIDDPEKSDMDNFSNALLNLELHAASYFFNDGKIHVGPNIGSVEARYKTHTEISRKVLSAAPLTASVISGYCIYKKFEIGGVEIDGVFSSDQNLADGVNYKSRAVKIMAPEYSKDPLLLLQVEDEFGESGLLLFVSGEHNPYQFKK